LRGKRVLKKKRCTYHNEFEEDVLVDVYELGVPGLECLGVGLGLGLGRVNVVLAVLDDACESFAFDVRQRDHALSAVVFDHVLYRLRLHRHTLFHLERLAVRAHQRYVLLHHACRRHCRFHRERERERERERVCRVGSWTLEVVGERVKVVMLLYRSCVRNLGGGVFVFVLGSEYNFSLLA
jgi:hypothetical protein